MNKELQTLEKMRQQLKSESNRYDFHNELDLIETTIKNQKRKLDLIGEILVDISKGNYSVRTAIDEMREVLEDE